MPVVVVCSVGLHYLDVEVGVFLAESRSEVNEVFLVPALLRLSIIYASSIHNPKPCQSGINFLSPFSFLLSCSFSVNCLLTDFVGLQQYS